jgi:transposase-like protein
MSIVSHLHHLFNPETCQAYIHTLRWKDRPLQCPRCQSLNVGPWGTYHAQPGLKRYRCKEKGCKRTFNDLTGTLLDGSKRSLMHWILATFLLCLSCSSRRIAKELGVHIRTGYRWCWWLRNAALSYEIGRKLAGTVEADDLYHTAGHKGQAKRGGTKSLGRTPRGRRKKREPGRGHYGLHTTFVQKLSGSVLIVEMSTITPLHRPSKGIAIHEQADDNIVHLHRFRETDRLAG